MRAYMIYREMEAEKNQAFIALFAAAGRELGIDFSYVPYSEFRGRPLPDIALNRTRDVSVSRWYEERGTAVFHSSVITELGNHKVKAVEFFRERLPGHILARKWAPATASVSGEQTAVWHAALSEGDFGVLREAQEILRSGEAVIPLARGEADAFVLKSVDGHGGDEVMALYPAGDAHILPGYRQYLEDGLKKLSGKECILQEMIRGGSRDVRVYILGNQIYQAVLRRGRGDFRSNYSLGGQVEAYTLSGGERELVQEFLEVFCGEILGMAGIDFIVAEDGRLIFNELEEMAGCRMLYQCADCDIVRDYTAWLGRYMENKGCRGKRYGI